MERIKRLKCNYKKENYTHNIHSENLENSYKTLHNLVDLVINFSENFKTFNPKYSKIKLLENKVEKIGKKP